MEEYPFGGVPAGSVGRGGGAEVRTVSAPLHAVSGPERDGRDQERAPESSIRRWAVATNISNRAWGGPGTGADWVGRQIGGGCAPRLIPPRDVSEGFGVEGASRRCWRWLGDLRRIAGSRDVHGWPPADCALADVRFCWNQDSPGRARRRGRSHGPGLSNRLGRARAPFQCSTPRRLTTRESG